MIMTLFIIIINVYLQKCHNYQLNFSFFFAFFQVSTVLSTLWMDSKFEKRPSLNGLC